MQLFKVELMITALYTAGQIIYNNQCHHLALSFEWKILINKLICKYTCQINVME